MLWNLMAAAVFGACGVACWVLLYNRLLFAMPDGVSKRILSPTSLALLGGAAALGGLWSGRSAWLLLPVAFAALLGLGELRRLAVRRRHRASGPIERRPSRTSWLRPFTTHRLAFLRYQVALPGWHGPALRVVHLSDFHVHPYAPPAFFDEVMAMANAAEPDLLFVTGDFVSRARHAPQLTGIFAQARARLGCFGVLGNHDYWVGREHVLGALAPTPLTIIEDDPIRLRPDGQPLTLSACGDPWHATPWRRPAAAGPLLVLTHTADNIYRLSRQGAGAVFAGHYHAGQGRLPLLGSVLVPSRFGRRFDHGHFLVEETHLFVTAGVGAGGPRLRIWCHPEVLTVDLLPEEER